MFNRILKLSFLLSVLVLLVGVKPVESFSGTITYDSKSFIINGKRTFITSGSIHYFRAPRSSWEDILLKAKLGGMNTIQTYIAWNFHEREEGKFTFDGNADIDYFLSLAEKLGLYVIVRPGPYICSEWDFGGFPSYLLTKKGIRLRTFDPLFLKYVDRYFDRVIPVSYTHLTLPTN